MKKESSRDQYLALISRLEALEAAVFTETVETAENEPQSTEPETPTE